LRVSSDKTFAGGRSTGSRDLFGRVLHVVVEVERGSYGKYHHASRI